MKRNLTCIVCPLGCNLEVSFDEQNNIQSITGNTCKRGAVYAEEECTHPSRVITTTVLCDDGCVVPVKTNKPIPKEKIFECMKQINACVVSLPLKAGDVIIKGVVGTDSDIIATADKTN